MLYGYIYNYDGAEDKVMVLVLMIDVLNHSQWALSHSLDNRAPARNLKGTARLKPFFATLTTLTFCESIIVVKSTCTL